MKGTSEMDMDERTYCTQRRRDEAVDKSHIRRTQVGERAAGKLETDTEDESRAGGRRPDAVRAHGGASSTTGTRRRVVCAVCVRAALLGVIDGAEKLAGTVPVLDADPAPGFEADAEAAKGEADPEGDGRHDGKGMRIGFIAALQDSRRTPRWRGARPGTGTPRRAGRAAPPSWSACRLRLRYYSRRRTRTGGLELDAAAVPGMMRRSAGGRRIIRGASVPAGVRRGERVGG
ncbi:hypothetical protein FB451DRAFT_1192546 [Mycena latifolia]|nr:hypothetical protein FB451DRAFT_1192546 [Mycena latifolia]